MYIVVKKRAICYSIIPSCACKLTDSYLCTVSFCVGPKYLTVSTHTQTTIMVYYLQAQSMV